MILALKTADETSELYLLDEANFAGSEPAISAEPAVMGQKKWQAGRELGRGLLGEIEQLLQARSLQGLVVFTGPGSFTGLRIGIATMNAIAYAESIPIVGASGENWLSDGLKRLKNHQNDKIVTPNYGRQPNITKSKN